METQARWRPWSSPDASSIGKQASASSDEEGSWREAAASALTSLRGQLTIPFVLPNLLVAFLVSLAVTRLITVSLEDRLVTFLVEAGRTSQERIAMQEADRTDALRVIASTAGVGEAAAANDLSRLQEILVPLKMNYGNDSVVVLDLGGQEIVGLWHLPDSTRVEDFALSTGRSFSEWPPFERVRAGQIDEHGIIHGGLAPTESGQALFAAGPLYFQGNLVGALLVGDYLDRTLQEASRDRVAALAAYGSDSSAIASSLSLDLASLSPLTGNAGKSDAVNIWMSSAVHDGTDYRALYVPLQLRGEEIGTLEVVLPTESILAANRAARYPMIALSALVGLATLVLGAALSRRVAEPLTRLTESAARVAEGHLGEQVSIRSSDEIGILAEGFNTMTGALRDFTDELRRKIAELAHLHDATHELTGELDLDRVVSASTEQIYLAGQLDLAALFLHEEGGSFVCHGIRAARADLAASLAGRAYHPRSDLDRASLQDLEPTILDGRLQWRGLKMQLGLEDYSGQVALIPLVAGEAQGFLLAALQDGRGKFDSDRVRLISTMAGGAARAVHNARLYEEGVDRVHELMAVGEMSRTISSYLSLDQVLEQAVREIRAAVKPGALQVALVDDGSGDLQIQAGYGLGRTLSFPRRMQDRLATRALDTGQPELHRQQAAEDNGRAEDRLYVPLLVDGEPVGVIAAVQGPDNRRLGEADVRVLSTIANEIAVAVRNARLYEDLRALYESAVRSLALAIDARDPHTHGHSVRVIENSLTVGRHLDLSHSALQNLEIAAHLHDIGKIGVPDGILKKPGALSREEKRKVDQHPKVGAQILGPLDFHPEVVQAVMHHHERFDGKGYPDGLKGEKIPIGARVLAVVDAFDAMVSDRPYRSALTLYEAIQELEENSGSQFDPVVVEAVLELVERGALRTPDTEGRAMTQPEAAEDTREK